KVDLANETLYVGTDCTQGGINGAGAIWQVLPGSPAPGPPLAPVNVVATNATAPGATTGSATVTWSPQFNGQSTTSYNVQTISAPDGVTPIGAPLNVAATPPSTVVPLTATVTGLALGTAVEFQVDACNSNGCSPFSANSNVITPSVPVAPGAPQNVSALAGNK